MKIFLDALGCPKALVDAERMLHSLRTADNSITSDPDEADAIIVNTCGFIDDAKQESINAILTYAEMKKSRPELKLIVTGCLTERYDLEIRKLIPEIDTIMGVRNPSIISEAIHSTQTSLIDQGDFKDTKGSSDRDLVFSGMNYAYLKISEGCDRRCSFCAIPGIRGNLRSRPIEDILTEASFLLDQGVQEIILIGEDLCSYGDDLDSATNLIILLENLLSLPIPWVRLLYLFPHPILREIAVLMTRYPNLCHYIDIPLQHASPAVLQAMNRPGDHSQYLAMLREMREIVPDLAIRSTFIIGFPGETQKDVDLLSDFLIEARLNRVGFFLYSDEEGTGAFSLPGKINHKQAQKRMDQLMLLQSSISKDLLSLQLGRILDCINDGIMEEWEGRSYLICRSRFDAPDIDGAIWVEINAEEFESLTLFPVMVTGIKDQNDLWGKLHEY